MPIQNKIWVLTVTDNDGGTGTATTTITVGSPPNITTEPADQTLEEGKSATFSVEAAGTEPISYQWQRDGVDISGATTAAYTTPPTTILDDGAQLSCVVSNSYGSVTSVQATLRIIEYVMIWIEAEDGILNAPMEISGDHPDASGEYIFVTNGQGSGGYAQYEFSVTTSRNYVVWGREISNSGLEDSFFVSVDDGVDILWDTELGGFETWAWDQVSNRDGDDPVLFYLEAGQHTLMIKQRENGTKIR